MSSTNEKTSPAWSATFKKAVAHAKNAVAECVGRLGRGRREEAGLEGAKLTRRFIKRCLVSMVVWVFMLVAGLMLGSLWANGRTWYGYELLYGPLNFVADHTWETLLVLFAVGAFVIVYRYWRETLVYIDELANAAEQLVAEDERAIQLPEDLHRIETRLNAAKVRAVEAEALAAAEAKRKNDLLVYLAHDLKTPLTSVIGYLQLLHDEQEISPELRRKYEDVALDRAQRLEDLVNEFFEVSRLNLSESSLELAEVNLSRMLEQELFEFQPMMEEKGLTYALDAEPDLQVRCDVRKVERVLDNLLRNAVNYSWPSTQIAVELKAEQRAGTEGVTLRVRNHGNTIAPEQLERLFEQFYRLSSSRDATTGGAGLGLAISRGLVQAHGGAIHAESAQDTATFVVWLPSCPPAR